LRRVNLGQICKGREGGTVIGFLGATLLGENLGGGG